ncbi:MAG: 50S ribosomal protein L4 [Bacteroidetes bacterium]|nr:50S ribosomal protein L4 [Bacteroidota bacterium]
MEVKVFKTNGQEAGRKVTLSEEIFAVEPNDHAIYMDIRSIRANEHMGLHKVKSRREVNGGGKKPWRQKGRGTARAGTTRSGVWVGGGSIFGPVPHDYVIGINKKMKRLAQKSALSYKAAESSLVVIEDFSVDKPSTKSLASIINNLALSAKKVLLVTTGSDKNLYLSGRNLSKASVKPVTDFSTYDVVNADVLLIQENALAGLERLTK